MSKVPLTQAYVAIFEKQVQDFNNAFNAFCEQIQKEYCKLATEAIFNKHPEIKAFRFWCYTPYFNDGDSCEYGVHADEIDVLADIELDCADELIKTTDGIWNKRCCGYGRSNIANKELIRTITQFVYSIPEYEKVYQRIFGDHIEVTVYRDRCDITDYDHD